MNINKPKAVLFGAGIAAFCCLFAVGLFWILQSDWSVQVQQLQSNQQLIVLSYAFGYIPGVLAGLMVIALLFIGLTLLLFADDNAQRLKPALIRFCTLAVLLSLAGVFVGEILLANNWNKQAQQQGYQACPFGSLLSNRLTYSAWVKDETLCFNTDIRRIVSRGTVEETQQVEQYLQAQKKQQQARQKLQQG